MLRATGHAHMVNRVTSIKAILPIIVRRAHPPTILNRFASNAEGLATSDKPITPYGCIFTLRQEG